MERQAEILEFAADMVRCPSMTGEEGEMAKLVAGKMKQLGYDEVKTDRMGNVIGRAGNGPDRIMFDSHMDTVGVIDEEDWSVDPFGGEMREGRLFGRGSVDMKGALAASIYAAAIARELGLLSEKSIFITASVMEEDYDGQAVRYLLEEEHLNPEAVVICEATELSIGYGHRGRALLQITARGQSVHGSCPELGVNPVYSLSRIIDRVEQLAEKLPGGPEGGSVAVTGLSCVTASANSVPESATITLDRRLSLEEDESYISREMEELIREEDAFWEITDIPGTSWRGEPILLHSFLPAWEIAADSVLVQCAKTACEAVTGKRASLEKMGFSTNAVTTAGIYKIPTVVIGPGSSKTAHMRDEFCPLDEILQACEIYANLCALYKEKKRG